MEKSMEKETNREVQKEEVIKDIVDKVNEAMDLSQAEELISNNEIIFDVDNVTYKVSKPTFKQKQDVYREKVRKFNDLLKDETLPLEEDLKKTLKKRGVDIDEMIQKIMSLERKKKDLQYKLGELLAKQGSKEDIETLKNEIISIQIIINDFLIRKSSFLEFSLEHQLIVYVYSYLTYLVSQKKVGDNWEPVWKSFDDFEKTEDDKVVQKLAFNAATICKDEI